MHAFAGLEVIELADFNGIERRSPKTGSPPTTPGAAACVRTSSSCRAAPRAAPRLRRHGPALRTAQTACPGPNPRDTNYPGRSRCRTIVARGKQSPFVLSVTTFRFLPLAEKYFFDVARSADLLQTLFLNWGLDWLKRRAPVNMSARCAGLACNVHARSRRYLLRYIHVPACSPCCVSDSRARPLGLRRSRTRPRRNLRDSASGQRRSTGVSRAAAGTRGVSRRGA